MNNDFEPHSWDKPPKPFSRGKKFLVAALALAVLVLLAALVWKAVGQ